MACSEHINLKVHHTATVTEVWDLSPTVKAVRIYVDDYQNVSFKAGQWVHFILPDVSRRGGYTVCNSPLDFAKTGILQLAVKYSDHPSTLWVHKECQIGHKVLISFGGSAHYDPKPDDPTHDLLLIGAGIGMNPLHCILNLVADLIDKGSETDGSRCYLPGNVHLLYSAKQTQDLLYKERLDELQKNYETISCHYFVTQEVPQEESITRGRIGMAELEGAFEIINKERCQVFICVPFEMICDIEEFLDNLKLDPNQIFPITWW